MSFFDDGQILLINKPYEWTSFDVVKKIRNLTKAKRVGHAGTLDPLATGLLVVCTGKATKQIAAIQDAEKEYTGTILLGATTPSFDREREIDQTFATTDLTLDLIQQAIENFKGEIMQVPPLHSAVKVKGQRAYELARKGIEHELKAKPITIREFEITDYDMPYLKFRVTCSKGTYIRSLVSDLGKALKNGAFLYDLCRTRIGEFQLKEAFVLEDFIRYAAEKRGIYT